MRNLKNLYERSRPEMARWLFILYIVLSFTGFTALTASGKDTYLLSFDEIVSYLRYILYAAMALKVFCDFCWGYVNRVFTVVAGAFFLVVFFLSREQTVLIMPLAILAASGLGKEELLELFGKTILWCITGTLLLVSIGLIENRILDYARLRMAVGFAWVTFPASLFLFSLCAIFTARRKYINGFVMLLLAILAILLFDVTNSRIIYLVSLLVLAIYFLNVFRNISFEWIYNKWIQRFIIVMPFVIGLFCILICVFYDKTNPIMRALNAVVSDRFRQGHIALTEYGLCLFGQKIEWNAFASNFDVTKPYSYVDCSYIRIALNFGIVFLLFYLSMYSFVLYQGLKQHHTLLVLMVICVLLLCIPEENLINASINPFVFYLSDFFVPGIKERWKNYWTYWRQPCQRNSQ